MKLSQRLAKQALSEQKKARRTTKNDSNATIQKTAGQKRKRKFMEESGHVDRLAKESFKEMKKLHNINKAKNQQVKRNVINSSKRKKYARRK